jgi:hypothetical protein
VTRPAWTEVAPAAIPAAGYPVLVALVAALWVKPEPLGWTVIAIVGLVGAAVRIAVFMRFPRRRTTPPPVLSHRRGRMPVPAHVGSAHGIELARRGGDGLDVLLLWDRCSGRVWVDVSRVSSGRSFTVDASAGNALDVFYHPFAYRTANTE